MNDKIQKRISQLTGLGYVYNEKYRNFAKGKHYVDHDVVVYGSDEQFEKVIKKATR